ncbi:hypothetical protein EC2845650_1076 [Escherichia coli 2845650]|nr:hypothetical protein EC2845650_1076 [Escherichia coli 2845650]KEO36139.1 hypothetical protein AC28_1126 [Escherichia coli 1-250-04_S3_C2]
MPGGQIAIAPEHSLPGNLYRMAGNIRVKKQKINNYSSA